MVPAIVVAGCGGVPGDAVAEVDGTSIKQDDFDRMMAVATKQNLPPGMALDEEDGFKKCIAGLKKQAASVKGQPKPKDAELKKQCEQQHDALRDQVMQALISYQWLKNEAERQDISVSEAELQKEFEKEKKQAFPKNTGKEYEKYVKQSGQKPELFEQDLRRNVELNVLSRKIRDKLLKGKDTVTDKEIQDYYTKNKSRFGQPEQRDLHMVMTKTEAKAKQARDALAGGASFKTVAKKYSIDQTTKNAGGKLENVTKGSGQGDKTFDAQVFGAKKGKLTGPIKTQYGYLVFEVDTITSAKGSSFEKSKKQIRNQLIAQKTNKVLEKFAKEFEERWRDETECRDEYRMPACKNAPEEDEEQPPAGAAPPGGQPAPQGGQPVPPQGGQPAPQAPPPSK